MRSLLLIVEKIKAALVESFNDAKPHIPVYGLASLSGYLCFYYFNQHLSVNEVHENYSLRLTAALLCLPIVFCDYWPKRLKRYLIGYWYVVLIYTLPFFFSFMLFSNPLSNIWHINGMICLIVLVLLCNVFSLFIVLSIGLTFALTFLYISFNYSLPIPRELVQVLSNYVGPMIYILLFSRKRDEIQREKLNNMSLAAESIAHELRTPLATMTMAAQALAQFLPIYFDAYKQAKAAGLAVKNISSWHEKHLEELPLLLENVSRNANTIINVLITNIDKDHYHELERCSARECVREALNFYPFSEGERDLVNFDDDGSDFLFMGHAELLKHVLFNLIKNSIFAIASAQKGKIFISIKPFLLGHESKGKKFHRLVFCDTGAGISQKALCHIFDRFYSNKIYGTGIGLAFCHSTMKHFGGRITCESELGQFTRFVLDFPVMTEVVPSTMRTKTKIKAKLKLRAVQEGRETAN